jgi:hypothetical protein
VIAGVIVLGAIIGGVVAATGGGGESAYQQGVDYAKAHFTGQASTTCDAFYALNSQKFQGCSVEAFALQGGPPPSVPSTTSTTAPAANIGDTLTGDNGATVQVISYGAVQQPEQYGLTPPNTTAITVKGCAGTVAASFNPYGFTLETADNSRIQPSYGVADQLNSDQVAPGDCTRGEVPFQVPVGQKVIAVLFNYAGIGYGRWTVP